MLVAVVLGTVIGAIAGMAKGLLDAFLLWVVDLFLSLPALPVLMLLVYMFREPLKQTVGPELGVFILVVCVIGGVSLDAGHKTGSRAVFVDPRKGICRIGQGFGGDDLIAA